MSELQSIRLIPDNEEAAVRSHYSKAAEAREPALCCPVKYDANLLKIIPQEILEKDYGCGDPTAYVRPGDTVLDLGSGGGKVCYIAAQIVGPQGRVIGVDCNPSMLSLARKYCPAVAEALGYANVEFHAGMIQDLALDLDLLEQELARHPVRTQVDWLNLRGIEDRLRRRQTMIADASVDCVLSNCVLNLVTPRDRQQLFQEVYRVLKPGGRAAISDIVADEDVPEELQRDPDLWAGCISGAFREDRFLQAFEQAGFHGIHIAKREKEPWRVIEGIEFRAITVLAYKGKQQPELDRNQAVIYRGPFKQVVDDAGHVFYRGERMAVSDKTFELLQSEPYAGLFEPVEPREAVSADSATPFEGCGPVLRSALKMKGSDYRATVSEASACCGGKESC